jgi:phosphotransferase system IIB component
MCGKRLSNEIKKREKVNNSAPFPVYDTEVIVDLKILEKMESKPNYDAQSVDYCKTCLSLALKDIKIPSEKSPSKNDSITYCIQCGNTEVDTAVTIHEWKAIYAERYDDKFLKDN